MCQTRIACRLRGIDTKPVNLYELFGAIRDVSSALVNLHVAIRWANVMMRRDGSNSWFLIDLWLQHKVRLIHRVGNT
ncbi:hypothetical protein JG688_00011268 [Phytophthora aleatoria]|uniref:Uncharacterized protein n=1 Tax=Phytophthora aleatoria TaxID=2496075 RepID=A0A8J5IMQ9_9STRA|nr:hypothetical protein JG688_00011268 [Phytophthora aleatoria]